MKDSKDQSIGMNINQKLDLNNNAPTDISIHLGGSFQGVKRLSVLAFDDANNGANNVARNSHTKYFLPRVNINN